MTLASPRVSLHTLAVAAFRLRELGIAIALLVAIVVFSARSDAFLTTGNWRNIAVSVAAVVTVAVGQTMVVLTRNIDLSVGSVVGLSAFISADTLSAHNGLPIAAVAAIAIAVGLGCGLVNGLLVTVGRVPAIIATLGTLYIFRGLVHQVSGGSQVLAFELPTSFKAFALREVLGVPALAVIAIVVAVLGAVVLRWTHWGRDFYAIGSNPEAARLSGIPVARRVLLAFAICGALAGLGGFMFAARFANVSAASGSGFEFDVISAVVIGGVNVFGGVGTVLGAVLGALFIGVIENGFTLLKINEFWKTAFQGFAIVAAVTVDALVTQRLQEALRRRRRREARAAAHAEGAA
jgi:rhamnose transport system permease protein